LGGKPNNKNHTTSNRVTPDSFYGLKSLNSTLNLSNRNDTYTNYAPSMNTQKTSKKKKQVRKNPSLKFGI